MTTDSTTPLLSRVARIRSTTLPAGGVGICEPQIGDWFYSAGQPNTWDQIYERDLPMLHGLGVNVLKTYFTWPWNQAVINPIPPKNQPLAPSRS